MKKTVVRIINCILVCMLFFGSVLPAYATSISEIQNNIKKDQDALSGINDSIAGLEDEQDILEEEISDLDAELLNTLAEIGVLEENIAVKEADIATTESLYEEAQEREDAQYAAMVSQIRFMYETGETDYLTTIFSASSFSEILNNASYIEAVYSYDQKLLDEYEATRVQVKELWDQLEAEKKDLLADKQSMEEQKVHLDTLLAEKKKQSADYDAQIAKAKQEAKALSAKIKQEQADLKKLQDAQKKSNAANGNYSVSTNVAEIINNAKGSELGKQIARYGCQFIGNPYVAGGTSLTKGADCSGFTYRIYSDFGYSIPRTSYQQRSAGKEVSYDNAQPGDLICYDGHVGLYIGGGYIVHASSAKTGIKVSKATYRTILSVRRII